jgi:hypothetical protein
VSIRTACVERIDRILRAEPEGSMTGIPTQPRPHRDSTAIEEPLLAEGREIAEIVRSDWAERYARCVSVPACGSHFVQAICRLRRRGVGCWMLDAGANSGEAAGFEGEVGDVLIHPGGFVHALSRQIRKTSASINHTVT